MHGTVDIFVQQLTRSSSHAVQARLVTFLHPGQSGFDLSLTMALASGTLLGPYRIDEPLGVGGMGEVYKATDTRLGRVVALKILPARLASHEELRDRFEREARAASSLNHPHICAVYDIGHEDGIDYLVLEYLEGETLAARLTRGPLPIEQVIEYASQIADALDKAHRHGIIHRDLKPRNLILTSRGAHLLDFGVAKWQPAAPAASLTEAPTTAGDLTEHGAVLGTFQYMAPEQLEGRKTDARTDIFALGALVYEMATGRKAFQGQTHTSLVTAILTTTPPAMRAVRPSIPDALDRIVAICLAKNPDDRWQSAHDLLLQLQWVAAPHAPAATRRLTLRMPLGSRRSLWWLGGVAAAVLLLVSLTKVMSAEWRPSASRDTVVRFIVGPSPGSTMTAASDPEISPDGHQLAFVASSENGIRTLLVRSLDSIAATQLEDTAGAADPFWSPDGRSLAFFAGGKLKKVEVSGGTPQVICNASEGTGTWGRNGTLLFTTGSAAGGLYRVPATGGQPQPATQLDASRHEVVHLWPHFLPDGDHFLFLALGFSAASTDRADGIYVASLKTGERKLVRPDASRPAYAAPGYLLFARNGRLLAQRFDPARLQVHGDAREVAGDIVSYRATGRAGFSISQNGVLVYQSGAPTTRLAWSDRAGHELGTIGVPADYGRFRLSPDGTRVVVEVADPQTGASDLWLTELNGGPSRQLTSDRSDETNAAWAADGRSIVFSSDREGPPDLFVIGVGSGKPIEGAAVKSVLRGPAVQNPNDWSPDGKWILYEELDPRRGWNVLLLPMANERDEHVQPRPLLTGPANEYGGRFSPDGRSIAYVSDESGRPEVYVRGLDDHARATKVSREGGTRPRWNPAGAELFFISDRDLLSVKLTRERDGSFAASEPARLFELGPADVTHYEVSPDGRRFLVNVPMNDTRAAPFVVTLNWPGDLGRPRAK